MVAWSLGAGFGGLWQAIPEQAARSLAYLNQAVYPFYILHQTIIVILAYYIVKTNDTVIMKYIYTVGVTLFFTMGIYHLLIKPYAITRFLFGMKPLEKKAERLETGELEIRKEARAEKWVEESVKMLV
jgi:glucan biosynthesis protein C